jgi:hypothetical protein
VTIKERNQPTDDLDLENAVGERDLDDMLDEGYSPPERALGVTKYGTTGEEQRAGESLDQRLAQETPDVRPEAAMHVDAGKDNAENEDDAL